jgi:hypothetical protein
VRWFFLITAILISVTACLPIKRQDVRFYNPICIQPYKNYHYLTCYPLIVDINHQTIIVPENFETDLASVPRIAWPVISPMKSYLVRPAVLHDWMYHAKTGYSRYEADLIFYHAMRIEGMGRIKACLIYRTVRMFGWMFYQKGKVYDQPERLAYSS